jgi:AcrR family transcriptional regulator
MADAVLGSHRVHRPLSASHDNGVRLRAGHQLEQAAEGRDGCGIWRLTPPRYSVTLMRKDTVEHMGRLPADAVSLDPTVIATAALRILDAEGPGALSFRRVAAALGTSHTTIHRHCGSFEGLLDICAEHLARRMPAIDPELPWAISTELRFTELYKVMRDHSSLVALQQGRPWLGTEMTRRFAEPALAASLLAGLTPAQMGECHLELYMFTLGCALLHLADDTEAGMAALAAVDAHDAPLIADHLEQLEDRRPEPEPFLHGIRTLIASWDPAMRPRTEGPKPSKAGRGMQAQ